MQVQWSVAIIFSFAFNSVKTDNKTLDSLNGTTCSNNETCEAGGGVDEARFLSSTCDNAGVPRVSNCSSDKATFCPLVDGEGNVNVRCQFCGVDLAKCGSVCDRNLSEAEGKSVVDLHNALRRKVAKGLETRGAGGGQLPKATDMFEVVWDQELANSAQRWADQCQDGHDKNRRTLQFSYAGQNVASASSSVRVQDKGLEQKIRAWYSEVLNWPATNTAKFSTDGIEGDVGHFTQMVWGATNKIGCGFIAYVDLQQPKLPFRETLVCNYGPGGNVLGEKVYSEAKANDSPASACPKGSDDGLCL